MLTVRNSIGRLLLYGGLTKEQFESVWPDAVQQNLRNLRMYAVVASLLFLGLFLASGLLGGFATANEAIYLWTCCSMAVIALFAFLVEQRARQLAMPLARLFMGVLYVFAVLVSLQHLEYPAVSVIVMLAIAPLLVIDRPLEVAAMTLAAAAVSCAIFSATKNPSLVYVDSWNIVTYGILALLANILLMGTKFETLHQTRRVAYLSETDLLTGLKNRNRYEHDLVEREALRAPGILCVYADANGLHELNNTCGHDAGDRMLQSIANEFKRIFGGECSYRIGGDEFVSLVPGMPVEEAKKLLQEAFRDLEAEGYIISYGVSVSTDEDEQLRNAIRRAEKEMYEQKAAYYRVHDRRRHRS